MWICEQQGNNPVKLKVTGSEDRDGTRMASVMEAELAEFPDPTIGVRWFPRRISQSRILISTGKDDELLDTEELTVVEAEFNIPIDKKQFTLAALEMPEETLIIHRPDAFAEREDKDYLAGIASVGTAERPFTKWKENEEADLTAVDVEARKIKQLPRHEAESSSRFRFILWVNLFLVSGLFLFLGLLRWIRH